MAEIDALRKRPIPRFASSMVIRELGPAGRARDDPDPYRRGEFLKPRASPSRAGVPSALPPLLPDGAEARPPGFGPLAGGRATTPWSAAWS